MISTNNKKKKLRTQNDNTNDYYNRVLVFGLARQGKNKTELPCHAKKTERYLNLIFIMQRVEPGPSWPEHTTETERRRFNHTLLQVLPTFLRLHTPDPRERIHHHRLPQVQSRIARREAAPSSLLRLQT